MFLLVIKILLVKNSSRNCLVALLFSLLYTGHDNFPLVFHSNHIWFSLYKLVYSFVYSSVPSILQPLFRLCSKLVRNPNQSLLQRLSHYTAFKCFKTTSSDLHWTSSDHQKASAKRRFSTVKLQLTLAFVLLPKLITMYSLSKKDLLAKTTDPQYPTSFIQNKRSWNNLLLTHYFWFPSPVCFAPHFIHHCFEKFNLLLYSQFNYFFKIFALHVLLVKIPQTKINFFSDLSSKP